VRSSGLHVINAVSMILRESIRANKIRGQVGGVIAHPAETLSELATSATLEAGPFSRFARGLPRITYRPYSTKQDVPWSEVEAVLPQVNDVAARLGFE
jgi:hypothetical protein